MHFYFKWSQTHIRYDSNLIFYLDAAYLETRTEQSIFHRFSALFLFHRFNWKISYAFLHPTEFNSIDNKQLPIL